MTELETPIYKLPYPRPISPVIYGAKDLQELAFRLDALLLELANAIYSPGDLKLSAYESVPTGWLLCNGQAVSRTTFAALFAIIGTTWGEGNKTTTFNVPDAKDKILIGVGPTSSGRPTHALGNTGGVETVTLAGAQSGVPQHRHSVQVAPGELPAAAAGNKRGGLGSHFTTGTSVDGQNTGSAGPTNAAAAHNNMPPYFVANWLIKT